MTRVRGAGAARPRLRSTPSRDVPPWLARPARPDSVGPVSRSRHPNFPAFIVTGALVGFVLASVVVFLGPQDERYTFTATLGYFAVMGGLLGGLGGGLVAVLLSRRD